MADPRRARGIAGEDAAAALLEDRGFVLVERNFRTRYGELDIVATDDDCLVFCEVRSRVGRGSAAITSALDSIGPGKRMQLRKMVGEWFRLSAVARPRTRWMRFDVVAVALTATGQVLATEHIRDAF
jgi:putative endonuclease